MSEVLRARHLLDRVYVVVSRWSALEAKVALKSLRFPTCCWARRLAGNFAEYPLLLAVNLYVVIRFDLFCICFVLIDSI